MSIFGGMQKWFNIRSCYIIHHINRPTEKNHVIISRDAEKAFAKFHLWILHTRVNENKVRIEGYFLDIYKMTSLTLINQAREFVH